MMRQLSLIVALVLSVAEGQVVNDFSSKLFDLWNLERPLTSFVSTTNIFTMDYGLSEEVELANIRAEIFTEECKYPRLTNGIKSKSIDTQGALVFEIEPEILSTNDKVFSNEGYPDKAVMVLCLRYGLWSGPETDENAIEVNYRETILTIDIDLSKGFEFVGVNVIPSEIDGDKGNIADREGYAVDGYLCDPITYEKIPSKGFSQGEFIAICSILSGSAEADGVFLKGVDYFYWTREFMLGGIPTTTIQYAIKDGVVANMLTEYNCPPGARFCFFRTMLFADFFTTPGTVYGTGQVSMQFGGIDERRHRLAEKPNLRSLQQQQQEANVGSSGLSIAIPVTSLNDRPGALGTAGGASKRISNLICIISSFVSAILIFS